MNSAWRHWPMALVLSAAAAVAAPVPAPQPGELFAGFRAVDGQGVSTSYLVKLGPDTVFRSAAPGTGFEVSGLGGVGADLSAVFGSDWATRGDVQWGIFGVRNSVSSTVYGSRGRTVAGEVAPAWPALNSTGRNGVAGAITSVLEGVGGYTGSEATAHSAVATVQANTSEASSYARQVGTPGTTDFSTLSQWTNIEASFAGGPAGAVLDLLDILTRGRDIRTRNGGSISLFAPGGGLALANTAIGNPLAPPGVVTESGGIISIFTDTDVSVGIGRIFTLRGGSQIIWSSTGDIAAGSSSKTVKSAPPTRVVIDPQRGAVQTDLAGLATGGGIGVLATVAGVEPGDVDLIAPTGVVDAGDAGIRSSGNLTIAATQVLNAGNIAVSGSSSGTPTTTVTAPNVSGLSAASAAAGATTAAGVDSATNAAKDALPQQAPSSALPSIYTVEVLCYGGMDDDTIPDAEDDEEERRRRAQEAERIN